MKRPVEVATVGYQGATVESFLRALREAGVDLLVDVRAVASSRRPGFAKSALAANRAGRPAEMRRIYRDHLKTEAAQSALDTLAGIVRSRRACLLCFEADPTHCHRSLVADALAALVYLRITHLAPALADPHLRHQGLGEDD
jgi:uncharacterized protein (DUF488 family)